MGAAVWPYQCAGWTANTRLERIRNHYEALERINRIIDFPVDGKIELADLSEIRNGVKVIIDQPGWFLREGQLSINLFSNDIRIYTLSFSLFHDQDGISAFVGAIQGRDIEGIMAEYRDLTKSSHGMRPRDLLFEIFRFLCLELKVSKILAVADEYRHHKDRGYFGDRAPEKMRANYDEIWTERGGRRVDAMYFEFEVAEPDRDFATVPAKKRGMYRRRFEMLGRLRQQIREKIGDPIGTTLSEEDDPREAQFLLHGHGGCSQRPRL